uniref:F-box domain-containing protein n=1 Tax=Leersia perrieri TaxID=77586 RepID=A0A0D9WHD1_9ORYZ
MMKTWSDLPPELVGAIAERLTSHADLARFRSVCPSWRSASADQAARRRVVPLLLLLSQHGSRRSRRVWHPADDTLGEIPLPAGRGRSFLFGSTRGWTLGVSADLSSATLVDPYTGASADLPPLPSSFRRGDGSGGGRVVIPRDLVWDWSPRAVVVSPGKGAIFCRPGDGSWSSPVAAAAVDARVTSITYCDGKFYLFDGATRKTLAVDAATFSDVAVIEPPPQLDQEMRAWPSWRRYEASLAVDVSSSDELLLLVRTQLLHPVCSGWTMDKKFFKAFRRSPHGGGGEIWSKVAEIGDRAVLVDHFRAFCVEVNGRNGLRRNCVYVASSYGEANDDYGMDVYGKYTVTVLDLANLETVELSRGRHGNLIMSRAANSGNGRLGPCRTSRLV